VSQAESRRQKLEIGKVKMEIGKGKFGAFSSVCVRMKASQDSSLRFALFGMTALEGGS
jgi:hypothetical protein